MKILGQLFLGFGIFLVPIGIVYGLMTQFTDWAGFPAILATAVMCFFLAFFLMFTDKKHPHQPNENLEGEIADTTGDYGFYSPWSWWPLMIGLVCAILVTGLAMWQVWVITLAIPLAILACVGWVYEYNRGDHAH